MKNSLIRSERARDQRGEACTECGLGTDAPVGQKIEGLLRAERCGLVTPAWFCLPGDIFARVLEHNGIDCAARSLFELGVSESERIRDALASPDLLLPDAFRTMLWEEAGCLSPHVASGLPLAQLPAPACQISCSVVVTQKADDPHQASIVDRLCEQVQSLEVHPVSERVRVGDPGYVEDLCAGVLRVAAAFFAEELQQDLRSCPALGFPPPRIWFSILVQRKEPAAASGVCWSRNPFVSDFFRRRRAVFDGSALCSTADSLPFDRISQRAVSWNVGADSSLSLGLQAESAVDSEEVLQPVGLGLTDESEVFELERLCSALESNSPHSVSFMWIRSAVTGQFMVLRVQKLIDAPLLAVQDELCASSSRVETEEAEWVEVSCGYPGVGGVLTRPLAGSLVSRRMDHHLAFMRGSGSVHRRSWLSEQSRAWGRRGASASLLLRAPAGVGLLAPDEQPGAGPVAVIGGRLLQRVSACAPVPSSWMRNLRAIRILGSAFTFLSRVPLVPERVKELVPASVDDLASCVNDLNVTVMRMAKRDRFAASLRIATDGLEGVLDRLAERAGMGAAERASLRLYDALALGSRRRKRLGGRLRHRFDAAVHTEYAFPLAELWRLAERFYSGEVPGRAAFEEAVRLGKGWTAHELRQSHAHLAAAIDQALAGDAFVAGQLPSFDEILREFVALLTFLRANKRGCLIRPTDPACEAPETVRQRMPHHMRLAAGACRRLIVWLADCEVENRASQLHSEVFLSKKVLSLGKRLFRLGEIEDPDDINFLTLDDLENYLCGRSLSPCLRELVLLRKCAEARGCASGAHGLDEPDAQEKRLQSPMRLRVWGPLALGWEGHEQRIFHLWAQRSERVGDEACLQAHPVVPGLVQGRVVRDSPGLNPEACIGCILVAHHIDDLLLARVGVAAGLVLESNRRDSASLAVSRALRIPTLVGVQGALSQLADGEQVLVDGVHGRLQRFVGKTGCVSEHGPAGVLSTVRSGNGRRDPFGDEEPLFGFPDPLTVPGREDSATLERLN
jgi:phosphohistidine swiveling domain-containing protein